MISMDLFLMISRISLVVSSIETPSQTNNKNRPRTYSPSPTAIIYPLATFLPPAHPRSSALIVHSSPIRITTATHRTRLAIHTYLLDDEGSFDEDIIPAITKQACLLCSYILSGVVCCICVLINFANSSEFPLLYHLRNRRVQWSPAHENETCVPSRNLVGCIYHVAFSRIPTSVFHSKTPSVVWLDSWGVFSTTNTEKYRCNQGNRCKFNPYPIVRWWTYSRRSGQSQRLFRRQFPLHPPKAYKIWLAKS